MLDMSAPANWATLLGLSVAADAAATAYLKISGDRIDGLGFFWAAVAGVVAFAPSIVLFGYALKTGPSYIATVGIWAVGVYTINAVLGFLAFGDTFSIRAAIGIVLACVTVILLRPV
jgi:multidrug transporter EmrE-like cation transporter